MSKTNWCLRWRTPVMPVSAFWYFDTEHEAKNAAAGLQSIAVWSIHPPTTEVDNDQN